MTDPKKAAGGVTVIGALLFMAGVGLLGAVTEWHVSIYLVTVVLPGVFAVLAVVFGMTAIAAGLFWVIAGRVFNLKVLKDD